MTLDEIRAIPRTAEAVYINGEAVTVKRYLDRRHRVLNRKDFTFKGEVLRTSKILLQTIKSIIDFHTSYLVGNAPTLTDDGEAVRVFNALYDKAGYALADYRIVSDLVTYGNSYEFVYRDKAGVIQSKIFDPLDSFPVYNEKGEYTAFLEYWHDLPTGNEFYNLYEPDTVTEYSTTETGRLLKTGS